MYKCCTTQAAARRQRELEEKLEQLLMQRPYDAVSVSGFCVYAEIPRRVFYRYFTGMEGALCALLDHTLGEIGWNPRHWQGVPEETLCRELTQMLEGCLRHRRLFLALAENHLETHLVRRALLFLQGGEPEQTRGFCPESGSREELAAVCVLYTMLAWQRQEFASPPAEVARELAHILKTPLSAIS